ncbi:MAG TPA: Hsp20/alpha crystallin family protein [Firmicutes bacterium]|nr:Hsp20/alpha crystallin family protein [Bacillota bacterium]
MFNLSTFVDSQENSAAFNVFDLINQMENIFVTTVQPHVGSFKPLEVKDEGFQYVATLSLPNLNKEAVKLVLEDNLLIISIEQKTQISDANFQSYQSNFMKQTLNVSDVETHKIHAIFKQQILTITLPKKDMTLVERRVIDIN